MNEKEDKLNEIAYRKFKTDYKYISLDVCKVEVLEEFVKVQQEQIEALLDNHGLTKAKIENIAQAETIKELRAEISNLLAIIHRDGGHHKEKVGISQAIKDAIEQIGKERDTAEYLIQREMKINQSQAVEIERLKEILKRSIPYLENHEDQGPPGYGWKSEDLQKLINEIVEILES